MNVNFNLRKEDEYLWRVAKARAKDEGITLSRLVVKALMCYFAKDNSTPKD